ncbi:MAG: Vitamin B12 transporter BtuB [Gemmatimonadaceae bacterium]|nr:Vitamin B12 transporter BtuB [Gemmatimonadaceae bacterium]
MRRYLPGVFAIAILHGQLRAQQSDSLARQRMLDSVVVTATRTATSSRTATVTVLDGEMLRREGYLHVADALRSVPGVALVQLGSFGGLTSLYLRGGERGYTRVLLDGIPLNEPGGDFDFGALSTSDVERIEIVRGPVSALYGSDAIAGVVQIFTRQGRSSTARLAASAGSFGTSTVDASIERASDTRNLAASVARYRTAGIYAFNNSADNSSVTLSATGLFPRGTEARLLARYTDTEAHIPTDGTGAVVDRNAVQGSRRTMVSASLRGNLWRNGLGSLQASTVQRAGSYDDRPDDASDTLGFFGYRSLDDVDRYTVDANATYDVGNLGLAMIGVTAERESQRSMNQSQSQYGDDDGVLIAARRTHSLYGQVVRDRGWTSLVLSGRSDRSDAYGTFFSYRAGAEVRRGAIRAHAAFGTGFRAPTFFEAFATGFARGNPHLRPERTTSAELGLSWEANGGRIRTAVAAFDQRFRDLIQYTYAPPSPTDPNYYNIAGARSRGIEAEGQLQLTEALSATVSATRLNARATQAGFDTSATSYFHVGERLLRRPSVSGAAAIVYAGRVGNIGVRANYTGSRDDIDYAAYERIALSSYTTVDLFLRAAVPGAARDRGLYFRASATNVLGERYQAVSGFDAPGRAILVGFEAAR